MRKGQWRRNTNVCSSNLTSSCTLSYIYIYIHIYMYFGKRNALSKVLVQAHSSNQDCTNRLISIGTRFAPFMISSSTGTALLLIEGPRRADQKRIVFTNFSISIENQQARSVYASMHAAQNFPCFFPNERYLFSISRVMLRAQTYVHILFGAYVSRHIYVYMFMYIQAQNYICIFLQACNITRSTNRLFPRNV